jgi:diaminopimelate epimerase
MKSIPFIKMHGAGNDFVVVECRVEEFNLSDSDIKEICNRQKGVGCDQLVLLKASSVADVRVEFYNGDGSKSGACGNGTRCVASLIMMQNEEPTATIETGGGILECYATGEFSKDDEELYTVNMGAAKFGWQDIPLASEMDTLKLPIPAIEGWGDGASAVNMGNPHAVFFVDDNHAINLEVEGSALENNPIFPERANIEAVQIISRNEINLRVWERGAGETLACGSGACAAVAAGVRRKLLDNKVKVHLLGGDLDIEIIEGGDILMTGPVAIVFTGVIEL